MTKTKKAIRREYINIIEEVIAFCDKLTEEDHIGIIILKGECELLLNEKRITGLAMYRIVSLIYINAHIDYYGVTLKSELKELITHVENRLKTQ